jgi:hypothetical protein
MLPILSLAAWCLAAAPLADGQSTGPLDAEVTIVGRDQTAIPVPPPAGPPLFDLPEPDPRPLPSKRVAPIPPPSGPWTNPWATQAAMTLYYLLEPPS